MTVEVSWRNIMAQSRTIKCVLSVALAMFMLPTTASASATEHTVVRQDAQAQELSGLVEDIVAAGAPGAALRVNDGHTVRTATAGLADLRRRRPMRAELNYRAGSLTKPMVATVVLQLVGEGKLALTDTVERWLPGILPYGR
jgi:D-alanyl-D-alanine carboxypeptidase